MTVNLQRLVKRPLVTEWCLDEEDDGDRRLGLGGGDFGLSLGGGDLGLGGGDGLPLVESLQTYSALQRL